MSDFPNEEGSLSGPGTASEITRSQFVSVQPVFRTSTLTPGTPLGMGHANTDPRTPPSVVMPDLLQDVNRML